MIIDHIENWSTYTLGDAWEKAFDFLLKLTPDADEKKYQIEGDDIVATVMSYTTKEETAPEAKLEAHRKYADIQMALIHSERIAIYPTHTLKSKGPYDAIKDVEFYEYPGKAALQCTMQPGSFALLLPQDAHMPALETGTPGKVKKVVVKIALDRLRL